MSHRMIVIPWEEYNRLKGAIEGKGTPPTEAVEKGADSLDSAEQTVPVDKDSAEQTAPVDKDTTEQTAPVDKEQKLKGPPGIPASRWLPWT